MPRTRRRKSRSEFSLVEALDTSLETLVIFVLVFTPLAFGTVQPWSKFLFVLTVGLLGLLGLVRCFVVDKQEPVRPAFSLELGIGLLFCLLLCFQIVPLPKSIVEVLSPNTTAILDKAMPGVEAGGFLTLSLYPLATIRDLAVAISLCTFFWVLITHFNTPDKSRRVMLTAASVGGIIGLIALVHQLFGLKFLFGAMQTQGATASGGVFVNSNNFGQFALLTLGITAGVGLYQLRRVWGLQKSQKKQPSDDVLLKLQSQRALLAVLCVGGLILIASIGGSTSRASIVGLILGILTVGLLQVSRMPKRSVFALWAVGLLAVVFMLSLTSIDSIFDQATDVQSAFHAFSHRTYVAGDLLGMFLQFKLFGVGQGTHSVVYPYFQSFMSDKFIEYGDLDYFQFLAETGVAGVLLLVTLVAVVVWRSYVTLRAKNHRLQIAVIGLLGGLVGIAVVSMSDFGQRFPGVSVFTVLSVALIVNLSRLRKESKGDAEDTEASGVFHPDQADQAKETAGQPRQAAWGYPVAWSAAGVLVVAGLFSIWVYFCDMRAAHWHAQYKAQDAFLIDNSPGPESAHRLRLQYAQNAVYWQPRNVVFAHDLISARWHTLVTMAAVDPTLIKQPKWLADADRIASQVAEARWLAPTYAKLPSTLAQIQIFTLGKPVAVETARLSVMLSASDPTVLFPAGVICAQAQDHEAATNYFRTALLCSSGRFFERTRNFLVGDLKRPDLLLASIPDNIVVAGLAYRELKSKPQGYESIIAPLRRKCIALLEGMSNFKTNRIFLAYQGQLAQAYYDDGQYQKAAELLGEVPAVLGIAGYHRLKMLVEFQLGNYPKALESARVLVSINPNNQANVDAIQEKIAEEARHSSATQTVPPEQTPAGLP